LITGNSYSTEVSTGNYDAMTGLLLTGDGRGHFTVGTSQTTGFIDDRDAKGMAMVNVSDSLSIVLVANNNSKLQAFAAKRNGKLIKAVSDDSYAIIKRKDGRSFRQEFYFGNGYHSASLRTIRIEDQFTSVMLYNWKGQKREGLPNSSHTGY
jgi:enediyne biosynthesis protein E4